MAEAYLRAGRRADEAVARGRSAVDLARKHKERANEEVGLRVLAEIAVRSEPPQVAIWSSSKYLTLLPFNPMLSSSLDRRLKQ